MDSPGACRREEIGPVMPNPHLPQDLRGMVWCNPWLCDDELRTTPAQVVLAAMESDKSLEVCQTLSHYSPPGRGGSSSITQKPKTARA